ncbi:hypothetical protein D3C78_1746440 [compost metagenome]
MLVHDDERQQSGIQHLDQILVLQLLGGQLDVHRGPILGGKALVELDQTLVVTGRLANEDLLSRQIINGGYLG